MELQQTTLPDHVHITYSVVMDDILGAVLTHFNYLVSVHGFRCINAGDQIRYENDKIYINFAYHERDGLITDFGRFGHKDARYPDQEETLCISSFLGIFDSYDDEFKGKIFPRRWPSPVSARVKDLADGMSRFGRGILIADEELFGLLRKAGQATDPQLFQDTIARARRLAEP